MKGLFRVIVFLIIGLSFIACAPSITATPSPIPSSTATTAATLTPIPTQTATATIAPTPSQEYVPPTLIPTIDPTLVPGLLSKAFSIQTMEGVNGHNIRQITGWEYGFGGGSPWHDACLAYYWLDTNHLLLYPATGQVAGAYGKNTNVVPQPAVINLETGRVWLPPEKATTSPEDCNLTYWSEELGIIISSVRVLPMADKDAVLTHTFDGQNAAHYWGNLLSVSPSGTKILVDDDTIIDLRDGKITELDWYMNYDNERDPYFHWTSDEQHIYGCCFYYADTSTGNSYSFESNDLRQANGNSGPEDTLLGGYSSWVRNDTHFLITWSYIDDGDIRYLPMIDPVKKKYYDVREMAGIPEDWTAFQYDVSPDGKYIWLAGGQGSYLVDLFTFEARYYPDLSGVDTEWSPNSQFVRLYLDNGVNQTGRYFEYSILSIADNEIRPFPVKPVNDWIHWWHKSNDILIYPSEDEYTLIFLDMSTMSFRKFPSTHQEKYSSGAVTWSPNGEEIAVVTKEGSIWLIDYPGLDNLEQLTPPLPNVHSVEWSPDDTSIAFISGSDIYVVETTK